MQAEIQTHAEKDRDIAEVDSTFLVQSMAVGGGYYDWVKKKQIKSALKQQKNVGTILYILKPYTKISVFKHADPKLAFWPLRQIQSVTCLYQ